MKFYTIADMNQLIIDNLYKIPHDINVVVGIPKSGMVVASLLSLYLNKTLSDVDGFVNERTMENGEIRKKTMTIIESIDNVKKILLVDDTIMSGKSMEMATNKIKNKFPKIEIITFALYVKEIDIAKKYLNIFLEKHPSLRFWEWNFMHHPYRTFSIELDGVLCQDPVGILANKNNDNYINFLTKAKPKFLPTTQINEIITGRLDIFEEVTKNWLNQYNIKYKKLIMKSPKKPREETYIFKSNIYKESQSKLFVESNKKQAEKIASLTGKFVYSLEDTKLYPI